MTHSRQEAFAAATPFPRRVRRAGMTLVEIMVAMSILTGALLGMGRFITGFTHSAADGALNSTASDLVLDRLEMIKASTPYTAISTYAGTESAIAGFPKFVRTTQTVRTNTAQGDYTTVTVTVSHPSLQTSVKKTTIISAF